LFAVN